MTAYYKFVRKPGVDADLNSQPLTVRFVPAGVVSKEELYEQAILIGNFSTAQVAGAIELVKKLVSFNLSRGYKVGFEGFGTFSLAITSPPVTDEKEIRSESISVKNVTFRPSPELLRELASTHFYRIGGFLPRKTLTPAERYESMLFYLATHSFMTRQEYMNINGCSKMTALNDLKRYIKEGLIDRTHYGNACLYVRKQE